MKFAAVSASLAVVAQAAAQSSSHGEHSDFDNIFGMVDNMRAEAAALQSQYIDMENELNILKETCTDITVSAESMASPAEPTSEPEPTPSPSKPTTESGPTPSPVKPTSEPEPTPSPTEPTTEPESAGDEAPPAPVQPDSEQQLGANSGSSGTGWVPKV